MAGFENLTIFRLTDKQVASDMGGETAILNHQRGTYYGLSDVGSIVWSKLETGPKTFGELILAVTEVFQVDEEEVGKDLNELFEELIKEELIEEVPKNDNS